MMQRKSKHKVLRTYAFEKQQNPIFYRMAIGYKEEYAYAFLALGKTPKSLIDCYACGGIERRKLGTASFSFEGTKKADIYYHPRYVLCGNKVISLLKNNNIVGYKICEINIEDSNSLSQKHMDELRELEIVGKCYKIFSTGNKEIKHCKVCKKVPEDEKIKADNGIKVVEEYWDGSDIFMFDYGLLHIIVTDKVKKLFEDNGISNVEFIPLEDLSMRQVFIKR